MILETIAYQKEFGVHYGGQDIGSCGSYSSISQLEAACSSDSNCVGYSTSKIYNMEEVPENDFYPWCLKRTKNIFMFEISY